MPRAAPISQSVLKGTTLFAVYAKEANFEDPLASVVVGERPDPIVEEGWVRVKVTHASLNRHDIFTPRGLTSQEEPIPFPMILGNDGAGLRDDGTPGWSPTDGDTVADIKRRARASADKDPYGSRAGEDEAADAADRATGLASGTTKQLPPPVATSPPSAVQTLPVPSSNSQSE